MTRGGVVGFALLAGCAQILGIEDPSAHGGNQGDGGTLMHPEAGLPFDGPGSGMFHPDATVCGVPTVAFGTATSYSATTSLGLAAGQLDGDGNVDAVVATLTGVLVFPGDGHGGFGGSHLLGGTSAPATGVLVGDVNADAHDDIIVWDGTAFGGGGSSTGGVSVYVQSASTPGTYAGPVQFTVPGLATVLGGHFDSDARFDLLAVDGSGFAPYYASPTSAGTYSAGTHTQTSAAPLLVTDLDGDGLDDVGLLSGQQIAVAYAGSAGAQFTLQAIGAGNADNLAVGHYTSPSGLKDVVLANAGTGSLFTQTAARTFLETNANAITGIMPFPAAFGGGLQSVDLNHDGRDDVVQQGNAVLQCTTAGTFAPGASFGGTNNQKGVNVFVDLDANGKPDLLELDNSVGTNSQFMKVSLQ